MVAPFIQLDSKAAHREARRSFDKKQKREKAIIAAGHRRQGLSLWLKKHGYFYTMLVATCLAAGPAVSNSKTSILKNCFKFFRIRCIKLR
jgi:hypothetical protein